MALTPDDLHKALYTWSFQHAVLSDEAMRDAISMNGDATLVPFDDTHAEYFKTRKIVKITKSKKGRISCFSMATRLPIARTKRQRMVNDFEAHFQDLKVSLEVVVERPFKIDQSVQTTFNPVYWHKGRIACGSSIGLGNQRNAGTLTALAKTAAGKLIGISCNHVTGGCNTASVGTPIVSPGIQDVSPDNHEITVIGLHDSTGPMSQGLPQVFDIQNNCDIAFFELVDNKLLTSMQGSGSDSYDTPIQFATVKQGLRVKKWGRSTDRTVGEISKIVNEPESIEYNVVSFYGPVSSQTFKGTVYYPELLEVESITISAFSAGGDSGALVVTDDQGEEKVIGILIGGNKVKSYVLPLEPILKKMQITLVNKINK